MKIIRVGNDIHVVSAIKAKTLKTLERVGQNIVKLTGADGETRKAFAFQTTGASNKSTAVFDSVTNDGYAEMIFISTGEPGEASTEDFIDSNLEMLNNIKEAEAKLKAVALAREDDIAEIKNRVQVITVNGGEA